MLDLIYNIIVNNNIFVYVRSQKHISAIVCGGSNSKVSSSDYMSVQISYHSFLDLQKPSCNGYTLHYI